jgi:hypothetical protein
VVPPEEELNLRYVAVTRAESECHSATWMRLCSHLGIFHRVLDQLALQPQQRALDEWNSENHSYFQRNIWLQYHWQWLRIQEEIPNLTTLTISLSEAVAADEAKAAKSNAVKVAALHNQGPRESSGDRSGLLTQSPCHRPHWRSGVPSGSLRAELAPAMPRPRYRQDPLPIGPDAPQVELFGPEQPNPPGLELMQQGHLEVLPLGPLFEGNQEEA